MSVKATAAQATERWKQNFGAASSRYIDGVNAVTVAPGQLAAAQADTWLNRLNESKSLYAAKVAAVDLGTWKNAAATTGAARLATGATKGEPKVAAFQQKFLPQLKSAVDSLPSRGTYEQNMARSRAYADALHAQKGNF